jgi:hypothetical protein
MAPTALRCRTIGTQKKLSSGPPMFFLGTARFKNSGSLLTSGTTIGLPLSTTRPVIPSPRR